MTNTTPELKEFTPATIKRIIKKAYRVSGKVIVVIDDSLINNLGIDVEDIWFEEEQVQDGILLKLRRSSNKLG